MTRVSRSSAPATGGSSSSARLRKKSPTMRVLVTHMAHIDMANAFTHAFMHAFMHAFTPAAETSAPFGSLLAAALRMFSYHFMQNALLAGTISAVVAGIVGYFM